MEIQYKLELPFTNDDPNFALGFEMGFLYSRMGLLNTIRIGTTIHAKNFDQLILMADHLGWQCEPSETIDDTWLEVSLTKETTDEDSG